MAHDGPGYQPEEQDMARPISRVLKWGFVLAFVIPMLVMLLGSVPNARRRQGSRQQSDLHEQLAT